MSVDLLSGLVWDDVISSLRIATALERPPRALKQWMKANTHEHIFDEVVVGIQGEHLYGVDGQAARMAPGVVLNLTRGRPHDKWYGPEHASCIDFWLRFLPHGQVHMNLVVHQPHTELIAVPVSVPEGEAFREMGRLGGLLNGYATTKEPDLARQSTFYLLYFLTYFLRRLSNRNLSQEKMDESAIVRGVRQYAVENLTEPLALKDLAKAAGYSPFHFHRMFVKAEGITPREFIENKRLELACSLLRQGSSVTAAAFDSGFVSSSQFARIFKKHLHLTPSQWVRLSEKKR